MKRSQVKVLFLGETFRADAQTWLKGINFFLDCQTETLEIPASNSKVERLFNAFRFFFDLLGKRRIVFDLVLAERSTSYGFFSLFTKRKVLVVAQQGITDVYPETFLSRLIKGALKRKVYQKADLIHAWGHVMVPAMLKHKAMPSKIMIMPKGIDLENFAFSPRNRSRTGEHVAIVTRSFKSYYNHAIIIRAIAILKNRGIQIRFIFVGGGELLESSKLLADRLGVSSSINFLGVVKNEELPLWLSKANIYVSIPQTEGVSASLFEAMASGCFPIVSDLPGTRAFIGNRRNGLLVSPDSADSLANALVHYMEHASEFEKALVENRAFIEEKVNQIKNFEIISQKYILLVNSK